MRKLLYFEAVHLAQYYIKTLFENIFLAFDEFTSKFETKAIAFKSGYR